VSEYCVEVEFAEAASATVGEAIVEAFSDLSGVAGVSDHGNATLIATVEARSLAEAGMDIAAHAALRRLPPLLALQVMGADEWEARQGFLPGRVVDALSVTEVAARLGVSRQRVHQLVEAGRIPATRVGHSILLARSDVAAYETARRPMRKVG